MIRIEVTPEVIVKAGNAKATGKPYEIHEQVAFAHLVSRDGTPQKYPTRILVRIERNERGDFTPYAPGDYQPAVSSFYVGDYGALSFSPRLVAIRPAVKAA